MTGFLRFFGLLNIAVWFGGAVFFTLGAGTAPFSQEMKTLLGTNNYPYFSGAIAQIFINRYFHLQLVCASLALLHLIVERLYLGKILQQFWVSLLIALFALSLVGTYWLQPKMKVLHANKYAVNLAPAVREAAGQSFRSWHAATQIANLLMLIALGAYFWHLANPPDPTRFLSTSKFRS